MSASVSLLPALSTTRAQELVSRFHHAPVLVIGDAMLDRFIVGRVSRISPEAPVPVVAFDHETFRIGGAANVAHNIAALGGSVTLVSVTGKDEGASTLAEACRVAGVAPVLVGDLTRPTTTKTRIVTDRNQQVARVDRSHRVAGTPGLHARVRQLIDETVAACDVVLLADYGIGVLGPEIITQAIARCAADRRSTRAAGRTGP